MRKREEMGRFQNTQPVGEINRGGKQPPKSLSSVSVSNKFGNPNQKRGLSGPLAKNCRFLVRWVLDCAASQQ